MGFMLFISGVQVVSKWCPSGVQVVSTLFFLFFEFLNIFAGEKRKRGGDLFSIFNKTNQSTSTSGFRKIVR